MGVEESGIGDPVSRVGKRLKVMGILRDVLRQPSVGVIEDLPERGIVKYAKPVGVIASLVPTTNPELTPPGVGMFALKCRDAVIFSPHPRSRRTTLETVEIMRRALAREGAPVDLLQCLDRPSIPAAQYLMSQADLVQATGGRDMVKAAYSSGTPAYGVGAGNSTMVIDETADVAEAALNTRLSKTSDFGSGCSADGNLVVESSIYDALRDKLVEEGGHVTSPAETEALRAVYWDADGHRTPRHDRDLRAGARGSGGLRDRARPAVLHRRADGDRAAQPVQLGEARRGAGDVPLLGLRQRAGHGHGRSTRSAARATRAGSTRSTTSHIDRLATVAPVSRIMVRQPQSKANAGAFNNGMPMTSSLGCGTWGGNITTENIHLKHYMNVTWVSRPIAEDRPSEQELFGEFYGTPVD